MTPQQQTTFELLLIFAVVLLFSKAHLPDAINALFTYHPAPKTDLNPLTGIKLPKLPTNNG